MKFHEVPVGEKFKYNNIEYTKTEEVRVSCCKIKENCQEINSGAKAVLKPMDEVEKIG
jgi:hypothetical protein